MCSHAAYATTGGPRINPAELHFILQNNYYSSEYIRKSSVSGMEKPTPYLDSIIPRWNFGETAGLLRSEMLAPPARSAGQFWEPERKELEEVLRSNIEQF